MASSNPFVFVVGCARSGTTLLQRMLDRHPLLTVVNDTHFITSTFPASGAGDEPLTKAMVNQVVGYRRFHRLGLSNEEVKRAEGRALTYAGFVSALYDEVASKHGKSHAGEKTPVYVRHIPMLHGAFPNAKFVHITRDGRDVALSAMPWAERKRDPDETGTEKRGPARNGLWNEDPLGATALWWSKQVLAGMKAGKELGPTKYHQLRYEDLIEAPEELLASIAAFLDLPDAPEMAAYHVGKHDPKDEDTAKSAKKAWLPPTAGLRNWRRQMTQSDVALVDSLAGKALTSAGYGIGPELPGTARRAEMCRRVWSQDASAKSSTATAQVIGQ